MPSSPPREDALSSLQNALTDLENAARIPAKQRAVKISRYVDRVCTKAYEDGLSSQLVEALIDLITQPNELDQASTAAIIKNLYPTGKVSDECVIKVVGSLGHGIVKAGFPAQAALLKWLILVYDVLENPKILSQLYGVLFDLIDTIAIRAPLCHLLALITRRKHVRPFRIQMLLELARRVGNEPALVGLIRVYKDYYPDVIVGDVVSGRASVFTHPDTEWRDRLIHIQDAHAQRTQADISGRQAAFKVVRRGMMGVKRSKVSVVPEVHTSRAQETSVTLEEIENVNDFINRLEKIELPNQLVAVLGDPLLQKLFQLKSSDAILQRVDNWLLAFFEDQLEDGIHSGPALLDMLAAIQEYAAFTKNLPPACIRYLQSLLVDWNGVTGREVILDLLTYLPLTPFEELYQTTFQPLELALLDNTAASQLSLLTFYTSLLRRWTVTLLSTTPPPFSAATISALTTHTNNLALTLLQTSPTVPTHMTILSFYETTASLLSHPSLQSHLRITTPPSALIYTFPFTSSLASLSRLCAILALYKRAFESAMTKAQQQPPSQNPDPTNPDAPPAPAVIEPYPKDYVNHFNGFLMDICNFLWRSRAFNTSDMNALGCLLPPPLLPLLTSYVASLDTGLTLPSLFSLSYSPILCNLSISYVRELEDKQTSGGGEGNDDGEEIRIRHAGPVTQRSLVQLGKEGGLKLPWASYRLGVLQYLEKRGVAGVGELMYNTMKHLMTAREGGKV